jgi:hypothetical protein
MKKRFTEEQIIHANKRLEVADAKLKRMLANAMIEIDDIKFLLSKNF